MLQHWIYQILITKYILTYSYLITILPYSDHRYIIIIIKNEQDENSLHLIISVIDIVLVVYESYMCMCVKPSSMLSIYGRESATGSIYFFTPMFTPS